MSGETRDLIARVDKATEWKTAAPPDAARRLAAVCEELLKEHPGGGCKLQRDPSRLEWFCEALKADPWCQPCRDRALLERCDRKARGEA